MPTFAGSLKKQESSAKIQDPEQKPRAPHPLNEVQGRHPVAVCSHQPFAVGFRSPTQAEPRPGSGSAPGNSQHLPPNFIWVPGTPSHPTQPAHPARSVQGSQAVSGQPSSCSPPSFCPGSPDPASPWPRGHPLRACLWMALPTGPAQSSGHRAWRVDAEGSCQGTKPPQGTVPAAC